MRLYLLCLTLLTSALVLLTACARVGESGTGATPKPTATPVEPAIRLHYLGHSSFIFFFDNGMTLLTDYGQSRAYGLDSPIYDAGDFQPTLVSYSHHHADHDRGQIFAKATVLDGQDLILRGIELKAIPVMEKHRGDNYGYLITYQGLTVFHAGDSQGDIVNIADEATRKSVRELLPPRLDLLLVPIGWTREITAEAAAYVAFLQPRNVIPMHYWSGAEKKKFLELLKSSGEEYTFVDQGVPEWKLTVNGSASIMRVISLSAGPYKK